MNRLNEEQFDILLSFIENKLKKMKSFVCLEVKKEESIIYVFVNNTYHIADILAGYSIGNFIYDNFFNVDVGRYLSAANFPAGRIDIMFKIRDIEEKEDILNII